MAGLGANGAVGVKSTAGTTTDWPEILGGEGGPVAIDPNDSANWYVNNQAGVSIYLACRRREALRHIQPRPQLHNRSGRGYTSPLPVRLPVADVGQGRD